MGSYRCKVLISAPELGYWYVDHVSAVNSNIGLVCCCIACMNGTETICTGRSAMAGMAGIHCVLDI